MTCADRPRVGISRCLLGDDVRYDGGHKHDRWLTAVLGEVVEWVPVCPELEVGMGVPREPIHLVASADGVRAGTARVKLVGVTSATDWTASMVRFSRRRVAALAGMNLSGYILKKDSPTCGMTRVPVRAPRAAGDGPTRGGGPAVRTGRGLFAEALIAARPDLPVEEEGRLQDAALRENFIERVFACQRLRAHFAGRWTVGSLVGFHTRHKLQLLAHSRTGYTRLGRLVATAREHGRQELADTYRSGFMATLARPASPGRHADVMQHIFGHLTRALDAADRAELLASIDEHRRGLVPLVVPLTLLRHHVRRQGVSYLANQTYLEPYPLELALRNHV